MAKKGEKIRQYYIADLDIDKIIDYHIERKQPKVYDLDTPSGQFCMEQDLKKKVRKGKVINNNRLPLYHKIVYIIHLIAKRSTDNKYGMTNLNASVLQQLVGNDYQEILVSLELMNIITIIPIYEIGKYSMSYGIQKNYTDKISNKITTNPKLIKYNNKAKKLIKDNENGNQREIQQGAIATQIS